jgi:hypothetical protein
MMAAHARHLQPTLSIETIHCSLDPIDKPTIDRITNAATQRAKYLFFSWAKILQDIRCRVHPTRGTSDANADTREILRAQVLYDGLNAILTS